MKTAIAKIALEDIITLQLAMYHGRFLWECHPHGGRHCQFLQLSGTFLSSPLAVSGVICVT
jgi:hypothetical protein